MCEGRHSGSKEGLEQDLLYHIYQRVQRQKEVRMQQKYIGGLRLEEAMVVVLWAEGSK